MGSFPRQADRVLVELLVYGGLRIGEALALQRGDVHLADGTITIKRSVSEQNGVTGTKTHRARTVVLPGQVVDHLRGHLASSLAGQETPVFPSRTGRERSYRNVRRDTWDPAIAAYNRDRVHRGEPPVRLTPHDLRSICASLLVDAGASVKDVQEHLGHADVTTTLRVYARVHPERAASIARNLNTIVEQSTTPAPPDSTPLVHTLHPRLGDTA